MTLRAFAVGTLAALFLAGFGYVNDWILDLERSTSGHLIPIMIIGPLMLFVLSINTLLVRKRQNWAFRGSELALIFVLTSVACYIPGRSLMEHFTQVMVMPHHWYRVNPGWQEKKLRDYYPKEAFVDPDYSDTTVSGFVTGVGDPADRRLPAGERLRTRIERVPWGAWRTPLATWIPIVLLGMICYVCLALILHKQWSSHEHLAYPIADFVGSFLDVDKQGNGRSTLFTNRLFWIGFALIFALRLNNGLQRWFPDYLIPIKLDFNFSPFLDLFPAFRRMRWGPTLFRANIFPLVVSFSFLLSTEISLTMGLSQILWVLFACPFTVMGVNFRTSYMRGWTGWQRGGSYIAFAIMLFYIGRNYYLRIFRQAFLRWRKPETDSGATWAMRFLLLAAILLLLLVHRLGIALPFAFATLFLAMLSCVIVTRISAETGLFFIHPLWQPCGILIAMLGGYMFNPSALAIAILIGFMFSMDQSQALLPYLANGLKVCERFQLPRPAVSWSTFGICSIGLVLAVAVALVAIYDQGTPAQCRWSYDVLPKISFQMLDREVLRLESTDQLEDAETLPWYQKLNGIHAEKNFYWAFGFGFFAVLVFSFLRLRLPKWPLHPVLFLVWATWPMHVFAYSILFGWLIKTLVLRFGGNATVQRLRPLMFGVISAEIMGALTFTLIGLIYFLVTGKPPVAYRYFPR